MNSKVSLVAAVVALFALLAPMAAARTKNVVVYSYKDWEVRAVLWDDGAMSCVAEVTYPGEAFSIWADRRHPIRLQFYSSKWHFNTSRADLRVKIDQYPTWKLHNARLYKHSVLFNLPSSRSGTKFLLEVAHGNTLYLRDRNGRRVQYYSLAGSRASMSALLKCVKRLR
jgi:hypothetical protein